MGGETRGAWLPCEMENLSSEKQTKKSGGKESRAIQRVQGGAFEEG